MSRDQSGSHTLASESLGDGGGTGGRDYQEVMNLSTVVMVLCWVHESKLTKLYILGQCNLLYVNYILAKLLKKKSPGGLGILHF